MRSVYERLSKIEHKRLSFCHFTINIIESIVFHGIRTIRTILVCLSIIVVIAVSEAVCLMNITTLLVKFHLSKERFVPTELRNHLTRASHLPFSDDCSRISCILSQMCECSFIVIHISEADIIAVAVHSGHHLHAARAAKRKGIHIGIHNTLLCQSIDIRGFILRSTVASEAFCPDVVGKEEYDIRLLLLSRSTSCCSHQRAESTDFLKIAHIRYFLLATI